MHFLSVLQTGKSKIKSGKVKVSNEILSLAHRWLPSVASSQSEPSGISSCKDNNLIGSGLHPRVLSSSNSKYLPKASSLNAIILGVRTSTYNFLEGRHSSVHSIIIMSTFQQLHFIIYILKGGKIPIFLRCQDPHGNCITKKKKAPFGPSRFSSSPYGLSKCKHLYILKLSCLPNHPPQSRTADIGSCKHCNPRTVNISEAVFRMATSHPSNLARNCS